MSAVLSPSVAVMRLAAPHVRARTGIAACAVVTAILAFFHLGAPSFWYDEASSAQFARLPFAQLAATLQQQDGFYAFYYLLLHGVSHLSESETALRALSALAAIGFTLTIAWLAYHLAGARAAVIAAIVATISPLVLGAAREARPYSLFLLLATLLSWAFVRAGEEPTRGRWIAFVAASVLACYVHLFAIFVVAAHALWALLSRRDLYRRGLLPSLVVIVAAVAPLIILVRGNGDVNAWIARPRAHEVAALLNVFSGSTKALALVALALCAAVALEARRTGRMTREPWLFVAVWLLAPIVLVFALSQLRPIFVDRYLDGAYPAYVLLVAIALARLPLAASAGVLVVLTVLMLKPMALQYHARNEDWRSATAFVLAAARPGDAVVVYPSYERRGYEYYQRRLGATAPPDETVGSEDAPRTPPLPPRALHASRLWVILAPRFDPAATTLVNDYLRPRVLHSRLALRSGFDGSVTVLRYDQ